MNKINIDSNENAVQLCELPQKREAARNPDVLLWQNSMCQTESDRFMEGGSGARPGGDDGQEQRKQGAQNGPGGKKQAYLDGLKT